MWFWVCGGGEGACIIEGIRSFNMWVIPSEKTEKNPTPLKFDFFAWNLITGLINDDLGHFWPPGPPWGASGAPEGFWGVWRTQFFQFPQGTIFCPGMNFFGPK